MDEDGSNSERSIQRGGGLREGEGSVERCTGKRATVSVVDRLGLRQRGARWCSGLLVAKTAPLERSERGG